MIPSTISHTSIAGNPITKRIFLVLCLNVYIPTIAPILPPKIAKMNKVCSLILHFPYFALLLFLSIFLQTHI